MQKLTRLDASTTSIDSAGDTLQTSVERKEVAFDKGTEHGSNEQVRTSRELVPVSASIEDSLGGKELETNETM